MRRECWVGQGGSLQGVQLERQSRSHGACSMCQGLSWGLVDRTMCPAHRGCQNHQGRSKWDREGTGVGWAQ